MAKYEKTIKEYGRPVKIFGKNIFDLINKLEEKAATMSNDSERHEVLQEVEHLNKKITNYTRV